MQQLTAQVANAGNAAVTWAVSPAGVGTVSAAGLYTAPGSIAAQQTVVVTATSVADPTKSASATITLMPPIGVSVAPSTATLYAAQTREFTATVTNAANTAVTWSLNPPGVGAITAAGVYTAPSPIASSHTVTITATSVVDVSKSASAIVTLPPVSITVAPATPVSLYAGQTQQFTSAVSNTTNTAVTWSLSPAGAGSITSAGLYTAPAVIAASQTVTMIATSQADPSKTASATVNLLAVVILSLTPHTVTLAPLQTQQFTATVANSSNSSVTWTLSPAGAGSITAGGLYTAPDCVAGQQTVTVIATSVADPTQSITATVTVASPNGFSFQRPISIDHNKVPNTDQVNFPVLITGTFGYLANVANGGKVQHAAGYDILFTSDLTGVSKLDHEVESYNPATGQFTAWVRIPTLSHSADTVIYLWYGNSAVAASQENRTGVWDTNYRAVWHLANSAADSTINSRNGSILGATGAVGQIGTAANFSGSGQYINIGDMGPRPARGTISLWVSAASQTNSPNAFTTGPLDTACGNAAIRFEVQPGGWFGAVNGSDTAGCTFARNFTVATTALTPLAWHAATITWDSALGTNTTYYNGAPVQTLTLNPYWPTNFGAVKIGVGGLNNQFWNGQVDEVRISGEIRSADWIATEYRNQSSPSTFYAIHAENAATVKVDPSTSALYGARTQQFAAAVVGGCSTPVVWSVTGAGSVSATGFYTAPSVISALQTVSVKATSQADVAKFGAATVTLLPPASVSVAPATVTMYGGQAQAFTAAVANAVNTAVTWTLSPVGVGSVSAAGVYTAPASITTQQTVIVQATSQADVTKSATAVITLAPGQGVSVSGGAFTHTLDLIAQALCRKPHVAPVVVMGPEQYTGLSGAPASGSATVTGLVTNYFLNPGQSLNYAWTLTTGPAPVVFATPNAASTTATFTVAGTYTLQLSVNDGLSTSSGLTTVIVNPTSTGTGSMFVTPMSSGPNGVNTLITLKVKWVWYFTTLSTVNSATVHFNVTGANAVSADVTTDLNGEATFTYFGRNAGTDTVVASGTTPNTGPFTSNPVTVSWIVPQPRLTSTSVTGRFFTADGSGTFNTVGTQQPVFTQLFPNVNFNPVNQLARPFTDVVTDAAGVVVGSIPTQGNGFRAGAGTLYNFSAVFTGALNVPAAGPVTFTFLSDDAFVFGIGNGATRVSGPLVNTPGVTAFQSYAVMGGVNQRGAPVTQSITVNFPAAGVYPYELDYAKGGDNKLTLSMLSGGVPIQPDIDNRRRWNHSSRHLHAYKHGNQQHILIE